jgi:hypothetical protein
MNTSVKALSCLAIIGVFAVGCSGHPGEEDSASERPVDVGTTEQAIAAPAPSFVGCDANQQTHLLSALSNARMMAMRANRALNNTSATDAPSSSLYRTWFGAYDQARYATVNTIFAKIAIALTTQAYTFMCEACPGDAFVDHPIPYVVHICSAYWTLPVNGHDVGQGNQAGTLIHETSHFNVVGNTNDTVGLESGCKSLSPAAAISAANCYEFLGEHTLGAGFMIVSDRDSGLAMTATNAQEQTTVTLSSVCNINKPECTWTYRNGMILNDADPALALNAWGGAAEGTILKVTKLCTPSNPDCTWSYRHGMLTSDKSIGLAVSTQGIAATGKPLFVTGVCKDSIPDCTWTFKNFMITSDANPQLPWNAFGGAQNGNNVWLNLACTLGNPDCTWTYSHGELLADGNHGIAVHSHKGPVIESPAVLSNVCSTADSNCTWSYRAGMFLSDTSNSLVLTTDGGTRNLGQPALSGSCNSGNSACTWGFERSN